MARSFVHERPDGEIRRSQVITTYGAGAMVDLTDKSVLISGTDFWKYGDAEALSVIDEPRLRRTLAPQVKEKLGIELDLQAPFREPPTTTGDNPSRFQGIEVREFPLWFVCQNPKCRRLRKPSPTELPKSGPLYHTDCDRSRKWECVPVRFVATCKDGHLEDFPWEEFVHMEGRCPASGALSLHEGASGDFSEMFVRCACGASRALKDAQVPKNNGFCNAQRPWLGQDAWEGPCKHHRRLLVRTATNTYFSQCVSALSIPEPERKLEKTVTELMDFLGAVESAEELAVYRKNKKAGPKLQPYSDDEILKTIAQLNSGEAVAPEGLRTAEYRQFMAQPPDQGEIPPKERDFFARSCPAPKGETSWPAQVERVVLARKLREVRVQVGFSRNEPVSPDLEGECDLGVGTARVGLHDNWLPANEIYGEGLFLRLSEAEIVAWEQRPAVIERERDLRAAHAVAIREGQTKMIFPGARFYLLHSLSHLLITAISLECGYSASAIRERIYCAEADKALPMAAILLSTGTPGSEGTLGGLVEQGRRLLQHLRRAYDAAKLCANDPVCADHNPRGDLSERFLEGAACHGCLYIAEPSCERFNRYLDRSLVVPTLGSSPELAFFQERP